MTVFWSLAAIMMLAALLFIVPPLLRNRELAAVSRDELNAEVIKAQLAELEADLAVAESFTPMTGGERLAFFREILPLVQPQNMPWKAADWDNPVEWKPREEPAGLAIWS